MHSKKINVKNLLISGVLISLIICSAMTIRIPTFLGYIHIGDTFIYTSVYFLNPILIFFVGGIGMAIADIVTGYSIYSFPSFIIHGIQGFLFYIFFINKIEREKSSTIFFWTAAIIGVFTVVLGYYFVEIFFYKNSITPLISLVFNTIQIFISSFISSIVYKFLKKFIKNN